MLQGLFNKLDKQSNNHQPAQLQNKGQYAQPHQQQQFYQQDASDDEFQIVKSKSEFIEGDRYKPYEEPIKKVESSIMTKQDVLRFTKQEIIEMYEAMLSERDEQIKFLKDKVAIQDRMHQQQKQQMANNKEIKYIQDKSNSELKIIPNRELNKVMGIRSPELTGSKKQFLNTGELFMASKYKYSNLRLEGEEDLSEEDVNEEDILQQFPRETQLTNNNGGSRGNRTQRSNAISYQTYRISKTQKINHPFNASLDSPNIEQMQGEVSKGLDPKNMQGVIDRGIPLSRAMQNENITHTPSKSNSICEGDSNLRVTSKKNFNLNIPQKGRDYSHQKESLTNIEELSKFDENAITNIEQLRTYQHPNNKRGSMLTQSTNKRIEDEINDGKTVPFKNSIVSSSYHHKGKQRVRSSTFINQSYYREERVNPEGNTRTIKGSFVTADGQPQEVQSYTHDMVYENVVSNQPSEHSGRALLREREQDSFNKAYTHMESLRLNKSIVRTNDESQRELTTVTATGGGNIFQGYKNNGQAVSYHQPHQSSDYLETMMTDKAMLAHDSQQQSTQAPQTQRQYQGSSTFTLFNTEQKTKIKMSKIAPKGGLDQSSIGAGPGHHSRKNNIGASSHEKLFKKKNVRQVGASVGSNDEMFRKKTMKRLVDDADILNQSSLSDEIEREHIQVINSSEKQESAFNTRKTNSFVNNISVDIHQIQFSKNKYIEQKDKFASWFGSPGPEAEFSCNEISEQFAIQKEMQNRDSQRHLQKFGPSGFTMGLKTPVKKALGEKNNFKRRVEDHNMSNSNITQEGSMSMVDTDGVEPHPQNPNTHNKDDYLQIEDKQGNLNPNVAIDFNDELRTERIEMLRKSIGRGHRGGTFTKNNNSFHLDATSDHGSAQGQQPPNVSISMYDEQNFGMQYYNKNNKLIEDFFVIGIDQEDVMQIEKGLSQKFHPDKNHRHEIQMPDNIFKQAKLLYTYSGNEDCPRRKVVKDFCFPSFSPEQLQLKRLKEQAEMNDILYGQRGLLRHNIFIFNMQADDMSDAQYQHDNVYHCICLINYEIVRIQHPSSVARSHHKPQDAYYEYYKCPKAYVIMSKQPFFSLFVDVLCQIIQIYKLEQLEQSKMLVGHHCNDSGMGADPEVSFQVQIINDVNAAIGMAVMVPQVKCFLDVLADIDLTETVQAFFGIRAKKNNPKLKIDYNYCQLSHSLPLNLSEFQKQAQMWHTPLLFSLLDTQDPAGQLLNILTCLLLEKSFIVVGRSNYRTSDKKMNTEEITLISAIVNSLPYFLCPITWVQTHIAILPNELIDILDAPMPYLVGVRAKEIVSQMGQQDESLFIDYLSGIECMEDKCVIEINSVSQIGLKIHNFGEEPMSEKSKFIQFDQETYQTLNHLLIQFQRTLKGKTVKQILQASAKSDMHIASNAFGSNNLKENGNKMVYDPCFNPTEHQQQLCSEIVDLIQKSIIEEILDPLEELSRLDNGFSTLNNPNRASNQQQQQEQVGNYTLDEARDFIRKNLTHKWVDGNSRTGLQQQMNGGGKRGTVRQPVQITKKINEDMDQFYRDLTQTQMMAQTIEGKIRLLNNW